MSFNLLPVAGSRISGDTAWAAVFRRQPEPVTLKASHVAIQGDPKEICLPIGFRVFSDGPSYFHGGLSLQEAVIPVIIYRAGRRPLVPSGKPKIEIRYRTERFTSRVIGLKFHLQGDLFFSSGQSADRGLQWGGSEGQGSGRSG